VQERVVENWLINTSERSMEVPFCQLLAGEGYRVVHLSRHGEMEQGKDILAIDPQGTPCAFQLKNASGKKITQGDWENIKAQIDRLVELPIRHPSVEEGVKHRAFLVVNGELDEPVRVEIVDRNKVWKQKDYPELETILLGELQHRFNHLQSNFWPVELNDVKALLELFLANGKAYLNKPKFSGFLRSNLPIGKQGVAKAECKRALASAAVFTSYALQPHQQEHNYVAEIEGWVLYSSYLLALAEQQHLEQEYWKGSFEISEFAIWQALRDLAVELSTHDQIVEGEILVDGPFYRPRITWLCGLLAAFGLWRLSKDDREEIDGSIAEFVKSNRAKLLLWGEAAIPQFLSTIWFLRKILPTSEPDQILASLISGITKLSLSGGVGIPDPYHDLEEVVRTNLGMQEGGWQETFRGRSYSLESLVQLYTRRNWRQQMRLFWPEISRLETSTFMPREIWQYYLWHCKEGDLVTTRPNMTQSWSELRNNSARIDRAKFPSLIQEYPWLLLLFIISCPHRLTADVAKFLDNKFSKSW
jgi:hypothetical protein